MWRTERAALIIIFLVGFLGQSFAQTNNSPYTVNGLGDINPLGFTTNQGMGGLGVSNGQTWYLNNVNPAMLTKNHFTVFEAGLSLENRKIADGAGKQTNFSGGLSYIALGLPVMVNKWSASVGIMPYSIVNYDILEKTVLDTVDVNYSYTGDGGLSQVFFANGFKVAKNLSLGVKASLIFGTIKKETKVTGVDIDVPFPYVSSRKSETSMSGVTFTTGLVYKIELDKKTFINTGLTYAFASNLGAENIETGELSVRGAVRTISIDTLTNSFNQKVHLPSSFAFGVSFEKLNKLTFGVDVHLTQWGDYKNVENTPHSLINTSKIIVGAEYTPDYTSVNGFLNRATYRVGIEQEKLPFKLSGEQINDFGINFGGSFPVGLSSLNIGFKIGQRGTTKNNLVKENYFRINFGVSFNDRWFQRRVLN